MGSVEEVVTVLKVALQEALAGHLVGVSIAKVHDGARLSADGVFACRNGAQRLLATASHTMARSIEEHSII
jgi:hypothetical protein